MSNKNQFDNYSQSEEEKSQLESSQDEDSEDSSEESNLSESEEEEEEEEEPTVVISDSELSISTDYQTPSDESEPEVRFESEVEEDEEMEEEEEEEKKDQPDEILRPPEKEEEEGDEGDEEEEEKPDTKKRKRPRQTIRGNIKDLVGYQHKLQLQKTCQIHMGKIIKEKEKNKQIRMRKQIELKNNPLKFLLSKPMDRINIVWDDTRRGILWKAQFQPSYVILLKRYPEKLRDHIELKTLLTSDILDRMKQTYEREYTQTMSEDQKEKMRAYHEKSRWWERITGRLIMKLPFFVYIVENIKGRSYLILYCKFIKFLDLKNFQASVLEVKCMEHQNPDKTIPSDWGLAILTFKYHQHKGWHHNERLLNALMDLPNSVKSTPIKKVEKKYILPMGFIDMNLAQELVKIRFLHGEDIMIHRRDQIQYEFKFRDYYSHLDPKRQKLVINVKYFQINTNITDPLDLLYNVENEYGILGCDPIGKMEDSFFANHRETQTGFLFDELKFPIEIQQLINADYQHYLKYKTPCSKLQKYLFSCASYDESLFLNILDFL